MVQAAAGESVDQSAGRAACGRDKTALQDVTERSIDPSIDLSPRSCEPTPHCAGIIATRTYTHMHFFSLSLSLSLPLLRSAL